MIAPTAKDYHITHDQVMEIAKGHLTSPITHEPKLLGEDEVFKKKERSLFWLQNQEAGITSYMRVNPMYMEMDYNSMRFFSTHHVNVIIGIV